MSSMHRELDRWLRDGRPSPMPAHLDDCEACKTALAEIDEVRGWLSDEPRGLGADAAAAIRFRLQSEARVAHDRLAAEHAGRSRRARRLTWGVAAAAVVLLAAGATALLSTSSAPHARSVAASIDAAPGSVYRHESARAAPNEVFRVRAGAVVFEVPRLARGRHMRVLVGGDVVEVRGTRFRVTARDDRLLGVDVERGIVVVRLASGEEHVLARGEHYRAAPVVAAAVPEQARPRAAESTVNPPAPIVAPIGAIERRSIRPSRVATLPRAAAARSDVEQRAPNEGGPGLDHAFHEAWQLLRSGRNDAAAYAFDALLERDDLVARRPDVLFWSASAHERAGRRDLAAARLRDLLRSHPDAWHADEARARLERLEPARPR